MVKRKREREKENFKKDVVKAKITTLLRKYTIHKLFAHI